MKIEIIIETKQCIICKKGKGMQEFSKNKEAQDNLTNRCKQCVKEYDKQRYLKYKEEIKERTKQYNLEHKEERKQYYIRNKDKFIEYRKQYAAQNKKIVFDHYGACACCGESNPGFLTIDHINNNGASHRKQINGPRANGSTMYAWIIKNNFPKDLQSFCYNCNCGKQTNAKKLCPHKE